MVTRKLNSKKNSGTTKNTGRKTSKPRQFYIEVNRYVPGSKPLFVGPFDSKVDAQKTIEQESTKGRELIMGNGTPADSKNAVHVDILPKIEARRSGLRSPDMGDKKKTLFDYIPDPTNWAKLVAGIEDNETIPEVSPSPQTETVAPIVETKNDMLGEIPVTGNGNGKQEHKTIIVTNFSSTVNWLEKHGIRGEVRNYIAHPDQIEGAVVIGVIPPWLAMRAEKIGYIDIPNLPRELRGQAISPDEMDRLGARLKWYKVTEVPQ